MVCLPVPPLPHFCKLLVINSVTSACEDHPPAGLCTTACEPRPSRGGLNVIVSRDILQRKASRTIDHRTQDTNPSFKREIPMRICKAETRTTKVFSVIAVAVLLVGGARLFQWPGAMPTVAHAAAATPSVAVGPQYNTTHVYVAEGDLDALVNSFVATFGGSSSKRSVANVTPVPSSTEMQAVLTPVGGLSIFAYQTPIPFPFGEERTGNLVTDMNQAIKDARVAGAEVIVEPFKDPIGIDAVIQWPGGVKMQLYWHFTPPTNAPLETIPDNRVYVSPDQADNFVRGFVAFAHGRVLADDKRADAAEIGRAGETFRRIEI